MSETCWRLFRNDGKGVTLPPVQGRRGASFSGTKMRSTLDRLTATICWYFPSEPRFGGMPCGELPGIMLMVIIIIFYGYAISRYNGVGYNHREDYHETPETTVLVRKKGILFLLLRLFRPARACISQTATHRYTHYARVTRT